MKQQIRWALLLLLVVAFSARGQTLLKNNDVVAICGDSITEQKEYSVLVEDYLLMCQPATGVRCAQFGWGGETSWGFAARMANDVLWLKPTVATTCYGMNDGGYSPMTEEKAARYRNAQRQVVQSFKKSGVRLIVVGSPGCVDADYYRRNPREAEAYNKTLAALRDIARSVATEEQVVFANVFDPMMEVMAKAKARHGPQYHLAGADGVHPARNGHLVMAYAFIKAMGCDGNIGLITVDLQTGQAQASDGHRVLSCNAGTVEMESSRYPFCFFGNPTSPDSTASVLEFLPFNQELNRLTLVVKNAPAQRLRVTWGRSSRDFSAQELASGVNLAAAFPDNPFCEPFRKVEQLIRGKQAYETVLHKVMLHDLPVFRANLPDETEAIDHISAAAQRRYQTLAQSCSAAVAPVRHALRIESLE